MTFLPHDAFFTGSLSDASPSSLLIGRRNNSYHFLVGESEGRKIAVALDRGNWRSFECGDNHSHFGLIVPNIYFEVEVLPEEEISDGEYGCLVRSGDTISIMSQPDRFTGADQYLIPLMSGLSAGVVGTTQSFRSWKVCWGKGVNRRVLYESPKMSDQKIIGE